MVLHLLLLPHRAFSGLLKSPSSGPNRLRAPCRRALSTFSSSSSSIGASSSNPPTAPPSSSSPQADEDDNEHLSGADLNVVATAYRSRPGTRFMVRSRAMREEAPLDLEDFEDSEEERKRKERKRPDHDIAAWRRYLTHPGVGPGTVFEREVMAQKVRRASAQERVHNYQLKKMGVVGDDVDVQDQQKSLKASMGMEALVEDRIQMSIAQGDFDYLPNKGKPLERERTPGLDRTTDLFMDILKRNGVKPEWIERQNRIKNMMALLRRRIEAEWALAYLSANPNHSHKPGSGPQDTNTVNHPCPNQFRERVHTMPTIRDDLTYLNREVDTYNLQVPSLALQRLRVKLDSIVEQAITPMSSLAHADELARLCSREGMMGPTCLVEYRSSQLDDDLHAGPAIRGAPSSYVTYWQAGVSPRARHLGKPKADPLFEALMIPVDGFARFLSRMFTI